MSLDYESLRLPLGVDPLDAGIERIEKPHYRKKSPLTSRQKANYHRSPVMPYLKLIGRSVVEDDSKLLKAKVSEVLFNDCIDELSGRVRPTAAHNIALMSIGKAKKLFRALDYGEVSGAHEKASMFNAQSKKSISHVNEQAADERYPALHVRLGNVSFGSTATGQKLVKCEVSDLTGALRRDCNEYSSMMIGVSVNEHWDGGSLVVATAASSDAAASAASLLDESRAIEGMYVTLDRCVERQFTLLEP